MDELGSPRKDMDRKEIEMITTLEWVSNIHNHMGIFLFMEQEDDNQLQSHEAFSIIIEDPKMSFQE